MTQRRAVKHEGAGLAAWTEAGNQMTLHPDQQSGRNSQPGFAVGGRTRRAQSFAEHLNGSNAAPAGRGGENLTEKGPKDDRQRENPVTLTGYLSQQMSWQQSSEKIFRLAHAQGAEASDFGPQPRPRPNRWPTMQPAGPAGKHRRRGSHSKPTATGMPVGCKSSQMTLKLAPFRTDPVQ
jgi:hypothetical protein